MRAYAGSGGQNQNRPLLGIAEEAIMCSCKGRVHTFTCYLRNIADNFVRGTNNR